MFKGWPASRAFPARHLRRAPRLALSPTPIKARCNGRQQKPPPRRGGGGASEASGGGGAYAAWHGSPRERVACKCRICARSGPPFHRQTKTAPIWRCVPKDTTPTLFACGELYCYAVVFGLRRVIFASRVYWERIEYNCSACRAISLLHSKNITLSKTAYH